MPVALRQSRRMTRRCVAAHCCWPSVQEDPPAATPPMAATPSPSAFVEGYAEQNHCPFSATGHRFRNTPPMICPCVHSQTCLTRGLPTCQKTHIDPSPHYGRMAARSLSRCALRRRSTAPTIRLPKNIGEYRSLPELPVMAALPR